MLKNKQQLKKQKILQELNADFDVSLALMHNLTETMEYQEIKGYFIEQLGEFMNKLFEYAELDSDPYEFQLKVKSMLLKINIIKKFLDTVEGDNDRFVADSNRKAKSEKDNSRS